MKESLNQFNIYLSVVQEQYTYISTHEINVDFRGNLSIIYITYTVAGAIHVLCCWLDKHNVVIIKTS